MAKSGSELIVLFVPFFLLLMLLEWLYFSMKKKSVYSVKDTLANLSCGAGQALFDGLALMLLLEVYANLQTALRIPLRELSVFNFLWSFVLVDLFYYIYHRLSHKIPFMWAVHVAHHSSDHYNFSVGLRQAWFHKVTAFPFYLILIFTGLPPNLIGLVVAAHAALQLLTHTQAFKKEIPLLRWIFVTPSHHRVHHGCQKQYVDKNFSGIFSFWDRLFLSYEPEIEPVVFGISPQLKTHNPWNINTHFWNELFPRFPLFRQMKARASSLLSSSLVFLFLFAATILYLLNQASLDLLWRLTLPVVLMAGFSFWGALVDAPQRESLSDRQLA